MGFGIGLIVCGFLLFSLSILIFLFKGIRNLVKAIAQLFALVFYVIYDYVMVTRKDKKTGYYQKQLQRNIELERKEAQKQEDYRREIMLGTMNFVSKMRVQYPCASEFIFQDILNELPKDNCKKTMKEYEEMLKQSHKENSLNTKNIIETKTYSLKDIESLDPIEVRTETPIEMSLYKIEDDYVLWVFNHKNHENTLLQTKDYLLMVNYMLDVLEAQQNLAKFKQSILATQLEDIFNDKKSSFEFENIEIPKTNRRF